MQHIDAAELHEYLDRGPADERLARIEAHISGCDVCSAQLEAVDAERSAASSILKAAAPMSRPLPLFETLVPKPRYETFETHVPTDVAFPKEHGQFREASVGFRGQAIMLAWAATILVAVGVGWLASTMYRGNTVAPLASVDWITIPADSALAATGGSVVTAEGAAILGYARGVVAGSNMIRVQQRTADGVSIDVIQPPGAGPATAPASDSLRDGPIGDRYVRNIEWNGRRITIVAPNAAAANAVSLTFLAEPRDGH